MNSLLIAGIALTVFGALFTLRAVWGLRNPKKDLSRNRENARRMLYGPKQLARITAQTVRVQEWVFVGGGLFFATCGIVMLVGSLVTLLTRG